MRCSTPPRRITDDQSDGSPLAGASHHGDWGSAIAIATWIGQGFGGALAIEVVTVVATLGYFVLGGRDSDFGAIFGSRPDERQANIDLRATAFTGITLVLLAIGGVIVTTAIGKPVWPFMLFAVVAGVTYVIGLLIFRHR